MKYIAGGNHLMSANLTLTALDSCSVTCVSHVLDIGVTFCISSGWAVTYLGHFGLLLAHAGRG